MISPGFVHLCSKMNTFHKTLSPVLTRILIFIVFYKMLLSTNIMPRPASVPKPEAVALVEKNIDHLKELPFPPWSSQVWKQMSADLNNRWTFQCVYNNVIQDRRGILSTAYQNLGLVDPRLPRHSLNDSTLDESRLSQGDSSFQVDEEPPGLTQFTIRITAEEWREMREPDVTYGDGRTYPILSRGVWTDIFSTAISKQTHLPCAFVFDNSKISKTPGSTHYLKIIGHCRCKICKNPLFGYLEKEPEENTDVDFVVKMRDTINDKHAHMKRPLRQRNRKKVGEEAFYQGCGNWQKDQINQNTKFGHRIPPYIPDLHIIRNAKKEFSNDKYNIKKPNVMDGIQEMRYSSAYRGYIHEVQEDRLYISFGSPQQIHAYNTYRRMSRHLSSICIDGSGCFVKPITHIDGSSTGHIFIYPITINFAGNTISVFDMLTESQDTFTITRFLKKFLEAGALKPTQAVCDLSRALMNAICMAFNEMTVPEYNEICFLYASKHAEYQHRPLISTYLRLDIAHFMNAVRRWSCFQDMRHAKVRRFFLYCVGSMIDCQTLEDFETIYSLTCIVGLHESNDTVVSNGRTVLDARERLEEHIASRKFNFDPDASCENAENEPEFSEKDEKVKNKNSHKSRVRDWIDNIMKKSSIVVIEGKDLNPFYFPDFIARFTPQAYQFCLWSNVAIPHVTGHASTSYAEGYFNLLRNQVLKDFNGTLRIDKFLKILYDEHQANATKMESELQIHHENNGPCPSPVLKQSVPNGSTKDSFQDGKNSGTNLKTDADSSASLSDSQMKTSTEAGYEEQLGDEEKNEISENESLHNKENDAWSSKLRPRATGIYCEPNEDIRHQNNLAGNMKRPMLLLNGNLVRVASIINSKCYFVRNTCGFDAIVQSIAAAAMADEHYLQEIHESKTPFLQFACEFLEFGACKKIYDARVRFLLTTFSDSITTAFDEVPELSSHVINVYGNLREIWVRCFDSQPSADLIYECPRCGNYESPLLTLSVNHKVVSDEGFKALEKCDAFNKPGKLHCSRSSCREKCNVDIKYSNQVFVELDVRGDLEQTSGKQCRLHEIPITINLGEQQYRLTSIIGYTPGHYIAYCYKGMKYWYVADDLQSKIITCDSRTKAVEPHGAIYVKFDGTESKKRKAADNDPRGASKKPHILISSSSDNLSTDDHGNEEKKFSSTRKPKKNPVKKRLNSNNDASSHQHIPNDCYTNSRDNWKNKEKKEANFMDQSEYTVDTSDDSILADDNINMLQSGNLLSPVIVGNQSVHVLDTDAFDSIVHVLWTAATNDSGFLNYVQQSMDDLFQLIGHYVSSATAKLVYSKRAEFLYSLCNTKICQQTEKLENDVPLLEVRVCGTPVEMWNICFKNSPSEWRMYDCNNCGHYIEPVIIKKPNMKKLGTKYNLLEKALEFYPVLKKVQCRQEKCTSKCTVNVTPNIHLFIDVQQSQGCTLKDLPQSIKLQCDYRLIGIIARQDERYVSYALSNGKWYLYSGYNTTPKITSPSMRIEPIGIIYLLRDCSKSEKIPQV